MTLLSAGCHTLCCAPSRGPRAPSCSLRDQAKNRSSLFHFKVTGGQYKCVVSSVQSLYRCVPLISWVTRAVYTRPVVQLARSSTNSVIIFQSHSWLSNRTKIPLESGSSADKKFRTDLKIFNKNCIIYVSQADVQSSKRSRVDLEPSLFFVSSPPSRKSSTNQKLTFTFTFFFRLYR